MPEDHGCRDILGELRSRGMSILRESVTFKGKSGFEHVFDMEIEDPRMEEGGPTLADITCELDEVDLLRFITKLYDVRRRGILIVRKADEDIRRLAEELGVRILLMDHGPED